MKKVDGEFIKGRIAPCGLHCGKCFAFADGDISYHSGELKKALGNFDVYAQRFVEMLDEPVFAKYPDFKEFLIIYLWRLVRGAEKKNASCSKPVMFVYAAKRSKWIIASSVTISLVKILVLMNIYIRDL